MLSRWLAAKVLVSHAGGLLREQAGRAGKGTVMVLVWVWCVCGVGDSPGRAGCRCDGVPAVVVCQHQHPPHLRR